MTWWAYCERIANTSRQRDIAERMGVDASNITRWKTSTPKAENVAAFARAYGRPVMEAFVAAGFLTAEEAKVRPAAEPDFDQLTDDQLLAILRERLQRGGGEHGGSAPTSNTGDDPLTSNLPRRYPMPVTSAAREDKD